MKRQGNMAPQKLSNHTINDLIDSEVDKTSIFIPKNDDKNN
jgi:hypothetical protein